MARLLAMPTSASIRYFIALLLVLIGSAAASPDPVRHNCISVSLRVEATANNVVFAHLPDTRNATDVKKFMLASLGNASAINGTKPVTVDLPLEGTYCKPPAGVRDRRTIQLLVHGISYSQSVWDGMYYSDVYDWHLSATAAGYHTLAIDRLGHGRNPRHPDPISVVQGPLHIEMLHNLIAILREGSMYMPSFPRVVYVGHSYGSTLGNHLAATYPNDSDAYVLTGFSSTLGNTIEFISDFFSAVYLRSRFKAYPLGYLSGQSKDIRERFFYGGRYRAALPYYDFLHEDTFTVGEILSPGTQPIATQYAGPVLVATGDVDQFFCDVGPSACQGILNKTGELFPRSRAFDTYMAPQSGHTLSLHLSAPKTFSAVNSWLDGVLPKH